MSKNEYIQSFPQGERLAHNFSRALLAVVRGIDALGAERLPLIGTFRNAAREYFYRDLMDAQMREAYPRTVVANRRDALTGAYNRGEFDRVMAEYDLTGAPAAIAIVDADRFKSINDTHGHQTGDDVLREVTAAVEKTSHRRHRFFRIGGEEFVLLLDNTGAAEAREECNHVREAIAGHDFRVRGTGEALPVTVSIGIAVRQPGQNMKDVVGAADRALYDAKQAGRNRVEVATPDAGPSRAPQP